jgi:hypothetical protein
VPYFKCPGCSLVVHLNSSAAPQTACPRCRVRLEQGWTPAPAPPSRPKSFHGGRCSACDGPLEPGVRIVHLFGEALHSDCALWTLAQHQTAPDLTHSLPGQP